MTVGRVVMRSDGGRSGWGLVCFAHGAISLGMVSRSGHSPIIVRGFCSVKYESESVGSMCLWMHGHGCASDAMGDSRLRGNDVGVCGNDVGVCGNGVGVCRNGVVGRGNGVGGCGKDGRWIYSLGAIRAGELGDSLRRYIERNPIADAGRRAFIRIRHAQNQTEPRCRTAYPWCGVA